jgi:hypothetical protein
MFALVLLSSAGTIRPQGSFSRKFCSKGVPAWTEALSEIIRVELLLKHKALRVIGVALGFLS